MTNIDLKYGCIADDFTGAGDAASFLKSSGLKTVLCTGIPRNPDSLAGCGAAVIALKSRSVDPHTAVRESLDAVKFLKRCGARKLYFKYCSTFDSTPEGNIGPVLDALLRLLDQRYTLICPSLPVNGRTVRDGRLYVDGVPLDQTHMRYHPVNPMWSSQISVLMKDQSSYPCFTLTLEEMKRALHNADSELPEAKTDDADAARSRSAEKAVELIEKKFEEEAGQAEHFYLVPDYYREEHGALIQSLFGGLELLSGGSGLLGHINARPRKTPDEGGLSASGHEKGSKGCSEEGESNLRTDRSARKKSIILSGSCSKMTLDQVAAYSEKAPAVRIDPHAVLDLSEDADTVWAKAGGRDGILIYSSQPPEETDITDPRLRRKLSSMLESLMARLSKKAVDSGYTNIIVAGGETSGAVIQSLGYDSFLVGEQIAPGVPALIPAEDPALTVILKSGNFGSADFFQKAVDCSAAY